MYVVPPTQTPQSATNPGNRCQSRDGGRVAFCKGKGTARATIPKKAHHVAFVYHTGNLRCI